VKKKPVIHGRSPTKKMGFNVGYMNYKPVIWIHIYGYMDYKLWVIWIINHGSVGPMYCDGDVL